MVRTQTIYIKDKNEKIRIKAKSRSYMNNPAGYNVVVFAYKQNYSGIWLKTDTKKYYYNLLEVDVVIEKSYIKFIKENR